MNIFLLGASGATGYEVLKRLLTDEHQIILLLRNPSRLDLSQLDSKNQVKTVQGDVLDLEKLTEHVAGCDLIISTLGTGKSNEYTEVYSQGGRNILKSMRANGIKKLITLTSGSIDLSDPGTDNFFMNRIIRPTYNKVYYDQTRWETILDDTDDIDWICVRPTNLVNKPLTSTYRVKLNHCPKGGWKISRADLADFISKQINSDDYIRKKPVLAY